MIRPRSQQKQYDEYWPGDPAFVQPPAHPGEDAAESAVEAWKKDVAEYELKLSNARELSDWSALRIGDEEPTRFVMKPVPMDHYRYLIDLVAGGRIGAAVWDALLLRLVLVGVVGLEGVGELKPHADSEFPRLGKIAPTSIITALDNADLRIVGDLAKAIRERAQGVSPK